MKIREKDKCVKNPTQDKHHVFQIVPGTGKGQPAPTWICKYCPETVKSN